MTTRSEIAPLGESVGALECIFIHAAMCTYHDLMSYRAVWASFDLGVGAKLSGGNSGPHVTCDTDAWSDFKFVGYPAEPTCIWILSDFQEGLLRQWSRKTIRLALVQRMSTCVAQGRFLANPNFKQQTNATAAR